MSKLGYVDSEYNEGVVESIQREFKQFVDVAQTILKQKKSLEHECDMRQKVIDDSVIVCDERLKLIQEISSSAKETK